MKVLVVGGGGREHAICWKLAQSPKVTELYCAPGNGGIAQVAQCVPIKATDVEGMVQWAKDNAMDFVMVAPDDPLALGMVDALEAAGIDFTYKVRNRTSPTMTASGSREQFGDANIRHDAHMEYRLFVHRDQLDWAQTFLKQ